MEHIDSIETSERHQPNWLRVFIALLVGTAAVQYFFGLTPVLDWIRPDASEIERYSL
jgi:hypothetical protein